MVAPVVAVRTHVAALVAAVPTPVVVPVVAVRTPVVALMVAVPLWLCRWWLYPCGCAGGGSTPMIALVAAVRTPVAAPVVAVPLWLPWCQQYLPLWLRRWWLYPCGCAGGGSTPVIALVAAVRTPVAAPVVAVPLWFPWCQQYLPLWLRQWWL